jgi:hypothetical protein
MDSERDTNLIQSSNSDKTYSHSPNQNTRYQRFLFAHKANNAKIDFKLSDRKARQIETSPLNAKNYMMKEQRTTKQVSLSPPFAKKLNIPVASSESIDQSFALGSKSNAKLT